MGSVKLKVKNILFLLIFAIFSATSLAKPSEGIAYLMNEKLSLFEWGLYKLEKHTDGLEFDKMNLLSSRSNIQFDWNKNRIKIKFTIYPKHDSLSQSTKKEICKKAILRIKQEFGIGFGIEYRKILGITRFFEHTGFEVKTRPKDLMDYIENATEIYVNIYASKEDKAPFNKIEACLSPLLGNEFFIVDPI